MIKSQLVLNIAGRFLHLSTHVVEKNVPVFRASKEIGKTASNGCLNLLSLSACLFKNSKPIRKSRNINDDVICGRRAGIDIVWKMEVNRLVSEVEPFSFKERYQAQQRRLFHPGKETRFRSSNFG